MGAAALVLFLLGFGLFWYRRRERKRRTLDGGHDQTEKPQLHSDHIPRVDHELEAALPPLPASELEASFPVRSPELPANEPAAEEVFGDSRTYKIKRRPVAQSAVEDSHL